MNKRLFVASAFALALSGCANFAPEHSRPQLATPIEYNAQYRPNGEYVASKLPWRDYIVDLRLEALIEIALANNRDLLASTARVAQARAQYRIEDSRKLPNVVGNAAATRQQSPVAGGSTTAEPGGGTSSSVTSNRFQVGVGVSSFELDFWGRLANLSEAARAEYLATVAAQRAFYLSLIADVASTYFQIVEAQEQMELAEATAESRREALRIAQLRLDAGVTSALPFRQAESLLTQAEQQLSAQQLQHAQLQNQLLVLVGGRITEGLPEGLTLAAQESGITFDAGLPSDLLLLRPDIIAAEERLRAARGSVGVARAAFFPSISLTGSAGLVSSALGGLFGTDGLTWSFGPAVSLPIFDWGAREAQLDMAKAREIEQVATYDLTVQNAFREVSDALAGRRWISEQVETLERAVEAQQSIARIANLRYSEGVADYLEVLDAERNLFAARQNLLTTRRAYHQNAVTLYVALGGGLAD
jgi:multidrug efflux system outer membrane protein